MRTWMKGQREAGFPQSHEKLFISIDENTEDITNDINDVYQIQDVALQIILDILFFSCVSSINHHSSSDYVFNSVNFLSCSGGEILQKSRPISYILRYPYFDLL
jgi:hypothetical protein